MKSLPILADLALTLPRRGVRDTAADLHSIVARPAAPRVMPRHLQVEIITRCNLACVMCPRTVALARAGTPEERSAWQRQMPLEVFERVLDDFPSLQTLSLHGIGEPLMHPHLDRMIEAGAARGARVRFTTNATLLDAERSERLVGAGLWELIVSMDGATAPVYESIRRQAEFGRVVENVRGLAEARRHLKSSNPRLHLNMVVCRSNYREAGRLVDLASTLNAEVVTLSRMQPPVGELNSEVCNPSEWATAVTEARRSARRVGLRLHVRGGGRSRRGRRKRTYKCLHPWLSAVVLINGDVMPCCNIHQTEFALGNVFREGFADVWGGAPYRSFRAELRRKESVPLPCRWCPDF